MPDIGVRELKIKASQIVRNVRERRARYVIAYRGRPVALLIPLDVPGPATGADDAGVNTWDELTRLGHQMASTWPAGQASAEALSEMRR